MNVVLDLDDTLYLERSYVESGFKAIDAFLSQRGVNGFYDYAWPAFNLESASNVYQDFFASESLPETLLLQCIEVYRNHKPTLTLLPDARIFLDTIFRNGEHQLFMITDGRDFQQQNKIDALGIEQMFEKVIITGAYGVEYFKPHPRAFVEIAGQQPEQCIYIGDNPSKDFIAPAQLGWQPSIRMRREGGLHFEQALQDQSVQEVGDFGEVKLTMI